MPDQSNVIPLPLAVAPPAKPEFVEGVFYDMPAETYHAIEAMSQSGAKEMRRSPAHYRWMREHPSEPTEAMKIGTLLHAAVLEPDNFEGLAAVLPEDAPRRPSRIQRNAKKPSAETLASIAFWDEFAEHTAGKLVLPADAYSSVLHMRDAVLRHEGARRLLQGSRREVSVFWIDRKYNVPCKARFDVLDTNGMLVASDLKTTEDASAEEFGRSIASFAYHAQAAHYINGAEHVFNKSPAFVLIAVEKHAPYGVACYALQSNQILAGGVLMDRAYAAYAEARRSGFWANYSHKIQPAVMPGWALRSAA